MRRKIELYIGGSLADLDQQDFILMTYALTDLTKPTAVRNSFSKQVTLPGTPANDAIFSHAYRVDRLVTPDTFNPLARTPFQIMDELGEVLQSGYIKLDRIDRNGGTHSYVVTLYGGLGSLIYALTYNDNGEKLTLADLPYKVADADFYMTINKTTIDRAWKRLAGIGNYPLFDIINFAPCYNGLPDKLDSNKARLQSDYDTIVELSRKYTEWETRDLRSYLQRPAISVAEVLTAIRDYAATKGKTIVWDDEVFNVANPYFAKSFMLLDMLTSFEDSTAGQVGESSAVKQELISNAYADIPMGGTVFLEGNTFESRADGSINFSAFDPSFFLKGDIATSVRAGTMGYLNYWDATQQAWHGTLIGVEAYARVGTGAGAVHVISKPYIFGQWNGDNDPRFQLLMSDLDTSLGFVAGGNEISGELGSLFEFPNMPVAANSNVAIFLGFYVYSDDAEGGEEDFLIYPSESGAAGAMTSQLKLYTSGGTFSLYAPAEGGSDVTFNKSMLLSNTCTPADFLLSFCRQFGLKIAELEPDKVSILSPNTFYTGAEDDLSKMVDHSALKVVPLTFNKKWQRLGHTLVESTKAQQYQKIYGKAYGVLDLDTGLEFNSETEDLLAGSAFKGGIAGKQSGIAYFDYFDGAQKWVNPALVMGYTDGAGTHYPQIAYRTPLNAAHPGYDGTPKPFGFIEDRNEQKGVNLAGMLVFLDEIKQNPGMYWLTDDYPSNENACWQMPTNADNYATKVTYLPVFHRYYALGGVVSRSLDFATPAEIYDPDLTITTASSLYTNYWQEYLEDLYDKSGKVMTAKVHFFGRKVGPALFRRFYYYEGSLWVLNKITNHSLTTYDPVECEFVMVGRKANYTAGQDI